MKLKLKVLLIISTLLTCLGVNFFATPATAQAETKTPATLSFDLDQLKQGYLEVIDCTSNGALRSQTKKCLLNEQEIAFLKEELARLFLEASPEIYNELLAQILLDYRTQLGRRPAIQSWLRMLQEVGQEQFNPSWANHPVSILVNDTLSAFTLSYLAYGTARGFWKSRGSNLKGLEQFRNVCKTTYQSLNSGRKSKLYVFGLSTAIGASRASMAMLREELVPPSSALESLQKTLVEEWIKNFDSFQKQVKSISVEKLLKNPNSETALLRKLSRSALYLESSFYSLNSESPAHGGLLQLYANSLNEQLKAIKNACSMATAQSCQF